MEGCYHGQLECVRLLVGRGASWHTRDHSGEVTTSTPTQTELAVSGAFPLPRFFGTALGSGWRPHQCRGLCPGGGSTGESGMQTE